jgi:hypothetical protein
MHKLFISQTASTPEIHFSPEEDLFVIRGTSSPEDVRAMYYPVIEWINGFIKTILEGKNKLYSSEKPLKFQADLAYFNSSSAKFIYDILSELKKLIPIGIPVVVEWHYDEEDIDLKEAGNDIAELLDMEFTYVPKKISNT